MKNARSILPVYFCHLSFLAAAAAPVALLLPQLAYADGGSSGGGGSGGGSSGGHTLFIQSAVENANGTVTLPLHRGTSHGGTVYYVMLDASDGNFAQQFGLNTSQKL